MKRLLLLLAGLAPVVGLCAATTVTIGAGYPQKLSLEWKDRQLYLNRAGGLALLFK